MGKKFLVEHQDIYSQPDGSVIMTVRNGDQEIQIGDWFGAFQITHIEAYGKSLKILPPNWTGRIILSGMPALFVQESDPEFIKWLNKAQT